MVKINSRKNFILGLFLIASVVLCSNFILAATTVTLSSPKSDDNYTTTLNFSAISDVNTTASSFNVTLYCNVSGGDIDNGTSGDIVATITNSSDADVLENAAVSISSLTEARGVNCSAWADNITDQLMSGAVLITIDRTAPNVTSWKNMTGTFINYKNYSAEDITINITVEDAVIGMSTGSVYFNITNSAGAQVTYIQGVNDTSTTSEYNITFNSGNGTFTDGLYNITIFARDSELSNLNDSEVMTIMIDNNTAPQLAAAPILPKDYGNYSGTVTLNASIFDYVGMGSVYFNISNISGNDNGTYTATNDGLSWFNGTSFDTTQYADGIYNISIHANDTIGNMNDTESYQIRIDNTAPTVSLTLSSSSIDYIIFTASVSDSGSGVDATEACTVSGTGASLTIVDGIQTITASNLDCGISYSYTVTCSDEAGNSGSSESTSYITDACGGTVGGSGGGGSGTSGMKYSITATELEAGYNKDLKSSDQTSFSLDSVAHKIIVKSVSASAVNIEVQSTPQLATLSIGEEKKFEISGDNYYDLSVKLNGVDGSFADMTIKKIHELMPIVAPETPQTTSTTSGEQPGNAEVTEQKSSGMVVFYVLLIMIIGIGAVAFIIYSKNKKLKKLLKTEKVTKHKHHHR